MAEQLFFKQKLNFLMPQLQNSSHKSPEANTDFSLIIFCGKKIEQKDPCLGNRYSQAKKEIKKSLLPSCPLVQVRPFRGASFWESITLKECLPCSPEVSGQ